MELSGEEKKLQALFSELKAAEAESAPRFARVWNRAQIKPRRSFAFNPAFVAAAAFVFCAVLAIAVWSQYQPQAPTQSVTQVNTPAATVKNEGAPVATTSASTPPVPSKETVTPRRTKPAVRGNDAQLATNRKLRRDAKAITDWQSPTSTLLSSSSDQLFSSLPQLNENANGLQSYLPSRPK